MSTIKVLGCPPGVSDSLGRQMPGGRWDEGRLSDLSTPRPDDEIWLVCVDAQGEYVRALGASAAPGPRSLLWIPRGADPLPFDDWTDSFAAQLAEGREADEALLGRAALCVQALDWPERVADVPPAWYALHPNGPRPLPVERLPFDAEERRHLEECEDCRAQAYDCLGQQATIYRAVSCPSVDRVEEWLEDAAPDAALEAHVRGCAPCRQSAARQAGLWGAAGLLDDVAAQAKLAAVGAVGRPKAAAAPFLSAALAWPRDTVQALSAWAAATAQALSASGGMTLRLATRSGSASVQEPASFDALLDRMEWEEPVTLAGGGHWLHVSPGDGEVTVRAGRSGSDRFDRFVVRFVRGGAPVASAAAEAGVVRLTADLFRAAAKAGAERVEIAVEESSSGERA